MGNQGMTNWKLSAFFVISLMLIAGLFSNAAMAADGDGDITAAGSPDGDSFTLVTEDGFFVPVGSTNYRLRFTYTTIDTQNSNPKLDMSDGRVKIKIPTNKGWAVTASSLRPVPDVTVTGNDVLDVTASYQNNYKEVWIKYPKTELTGDDAGNDMPDTVVVTIIVNVPVKRETVTFEASSRAKGVSTTQGFFKELTGIDGDDDDDLPDSISPMVRLGALDSVTVTSEPIVESSLPNFVNANTNVTLSFVYTGADEQDYRVSIPEDWVRYTDSGFDTLASPQQYTDKIADEGTGRDSFTLYVKTPNGRGLGVFDTESAPEGTDHYTDLDQGTQPSVTIGNISAGQGMVEISESDLYIGNEYENVKITFTAAGPMYSDPSRVNDDDPPTSVQSPGIGIVVPTGVDVSDLTSSKGTVEGPDASNVIRLPVTGLDEGDEIVLRATLTVMDSALAMTLITSGDNDGEDEFSSSFQAFTNTTSFSSAIVLVDANALERNPFNDDEDDVEITGGRIRAQAGSGELEIVKPKIVEKGAEDQEVQVKYTSVSNLAHILKVVLPFSSYSSGAKATDDISNSPITSSLPTLTWNPLPTGRSQSVTATVTKVNIPDQPGDYIVLSQVGGAVGDTPDADSGPPATITVVGTGEDVDFEIVDLDDGSSDPSPSYPAGSRQMIGFKFTARNTKVMEGGKFVIELPKLWTSASEKPSSGRAQVMEVIAEGAKAVSKLEKPLIVSGRKITYTFGEAGLARGKSVTIQYGVDPDGDKDYRAVMPSVAGDVVAKGHFLAAKGFTTYLVREMDVEITNVEDGHGTATIRPTSVEAGSDDNKITVKFKASGSMGGGRVSLEIPAGWGEMQNVSSTDPNYVTVTSRVEGVAGNYDDLDDADGDSRVIAELPDDFGAGKEVTFTYGGDPGTAEANAVAQDSVADYASFIIESDGDGDGDFAKLTSETAAPTGTDGLGKIYMDADGQLRVQVKSATAGVGTASVTIGASKGGSEQYRLDDGSLKSEERVHAADDETYLKFTYDPEQDITKGKLELTIPNTWSEPQDGTTGNPGYIRFRSTGDLGTSPVFNHGSSGSTVTVTIDDLDHDETIEIDYGRSGNGAVAPDTAGPSSFSMRVSGGEVSAGVSAPFIRIKSQLTIDVYSQRSGAGTAEVTVGDNEGDLHAGDEDREVEITYTSIGQIRDGQVQLTVPANWSPTTTEDEGDNVQIAPGRAHDGAPMFPVDDAKVVIAEGVNLSAGGTLTFIYTTTVQPTAEDDVEFTVAVNGGEGPGEDPVAIAVQPVIDVRAARMGTGDIAVTPLSVEADSEDNDIVFTYTAVGDIFFPTEFTVTVPQGWTSATAGTRTADKGRYTVAHKRGTTSIGGVEKLRPENGNMMARVKRSGRVQSGDTIVFTYYNATAPATPDTYEFQMMFGAEAIEAGPFEVLVQPASGATQIAILDVADLSSDEAVQTPVMVTVQLQGDDGNPAATEAELVITLSSDSTTGMFAAPAADGTMPAADAEYTATLEITIGAAMWEGMAYYMDSTLGTHELTATPDATSALDAAPGSVNVRTDNPEITSVDFDIADSAGTAKTGTLATTGDVVTVTAEADPNEALTFAIGTALTVRDLDESPATPGTYTGSWTVIADVNDGTHPVTATLGGETLAADNQLTVDTTAPAVSVTAPAAGMVVANGGMVTITVTVTDDTDVSVEADVSGLDSTQTDMVGLTAGTGDSYGVDIEISTNNTERNGMKTITVTATDAAGISGEGSVMVDLRNAVSFTSMIPDGISLFHVPLKVEGLDTVANLRAALGDNVIQIIAHRGGSDYDADSGDVAITADRGLIVVTNGGVEHKFVGEPWGSGTAMINVSTDGNNLIGVPVADPDVTMISDIIGLFPAGVVAAVVTAAGGNNYPRIDGPDDPDDAEVKGDAAYLVVVTGDGTATVSGPGWSNGGSASAAPIALSGYQLDTQTPVLSVYGSVVDEITGLAKEGFRAKVKNLSTKAALSEITSVEAADGFNMTFVDLTDAHAARVGDVLEISVNSPDPLVGVKPVRHIVTVDDVKNLRIQLEDLIAYEIPAETELLRNYPNPFNPETWIPYRLAEDADVSLTIYNVNGEMVRSIDVGHQSAAVYETRAKAIYWDGRNRFGEQVASGLYFYHLSAGDFSGTRRMVILK